MKGFLESFIPFLYETYQQSSLNVWKTVDIWFKILILNTFNKKVLNNNFEIVM